MQNELLKIQIAQLERLLKTKRLTFRNSFYIIFSDYPSESFLLDILSSNTNYCLFGSAMDSKITNEYLKLKG